jgi:enoyl-[acyl-carrier protein] reductase II
VPVVNFSLGKGDQLTRDVHAYGGKVIATVTTVKHALSAEQIGVDALLVTGHEAAAHGGEVTSMVLIPAISDAVSIPVIGAGGFADGRGLAAAICLGAGGVAMGSRFATSLESPMHERVKQAVAAKNQHDTVYSKNFDGIPARYMKTANSVRRTKKPMPFVLAAWEATKAAKLVNQSVLKILAGLVLMPSKVKLLAYFGAATPRLKAATEEGNLSEGVQFIGQSQGLIYDTQSTAQIIESTVDEAQSRLK